MTVLAGIALMPAFFKGNFMKKHLLQLIVTVFTVCIFISCAGKSAEDLLDQFESEINNAQQISVEIEKLLESGNEEDIVKAAEKEKEFFLQYRLFC